MLASSLVTNLCGQVPRITKAKWYFYDPGRRNTIVFSARDDRDGEPSSSRNNDQGSVIFPDSVPFASSDTDWREFRAQLVASTSSSNLEQEALEAAVSKRSDRWAHEISAAEPGCLLLASPIYFTHSQQYFSQSVVLIVAHGSEGSMGLILNKPTTRTMSDFQTDLGVEFDSCRLFLGGDVDETALNILHEIPNVPNAIQVLPGLYLGGFEGVRQALMNREATTEDVKLLTRYAGWGPGQLESEIGHNVWFPAAAARQVVTQHVEGATGESMWLSILELMGGEYARIAKAMNEDLSADIARTQQQEREDQQRMRSKEASSDAWPREDRRDSNHGSESHRDGSGI